jgi:hypothetical protein
MIEARTGSISDLWLVDPDGPKTYDPTDTVGMFPSSVPDPNSDPPDPHVFWPSGSTSQRYGSGSGYGSGSFYHDAKIKSYYFVTL